MDKSVGIPVMVALVWLINFGISIWNARLCGLVWVEAKQIGGFARFMVWCGAIMAFCGFLWCYAIIEAFVGHWLLPDMVTPQVMAGVFSLAYLIIIFPVLGIGFAFTASSIYEAWKRRDMASMGVAAWNTFAQVHNTYSAFEGVPQAWGNLKDVFGGNSTSSSSSSSEDAGKGVAALIVVFIVALAAVFAFLTTAGIIMKYAGTRELPDRERHAQDIRRQRA